MNDFEVPEEDHGLKLAHHLLGSDSPLDLRVLNALVGEPKRFRDLKPLVKGKSDTPLTRSLKRLGETGLIRQGMTLDEPGDPRYYALTKLGIHVVLKTHEMRPLADVLAEVRAAGLLAA